MNNNANKILVLLNAETLGFLAAERRSYSPAQALHTGGDGTGPDGEEPVQGEADGAARGC